MHGPVFGCNPEEVLDSDIRYGLKVTVKD